MATEDEPKSTSVAAGADTSALGNLPAILLVAELAAFMRVDRKTVYVIGRSDPEYLRPEVRRQETS